MLKFQILLWVLEIPNIFFGGRGGGGRTLNAGPSLRMKKNESISPLWSKAGVLDQRCNLH